MDSTSGTAAFATALECTHLKARTEPVHLPQTVVAEEKLFAERVGLLEESRACSGRTQKRVISLSLSNTLFE